MQSMYKQKHLSSCYLKTGPHTDRNGPQWSLLKASSSRTGELETRACAWTCPPRVVFDDPAREDSNLQHDAAPSTRYHALQPATHQSTKAKEKIRRDDDPARWDSNSQHNDDDHHNDNHDHFTTMTTFTTSILFPPQRPPPPRSFFHPHYPAWRFLYSFLLRGEHIAV